MVTCTINIMLHKTYFRLYELLPKIFRLKHVIRCETGSSVGIATGYRLDGPGIESRRGRDFLYLSRPALEPTQPPVQWVPGLSRGKERPGRDADPSPLSTAVPLWAVRPVQSLSACTRIHFIFTLTQFVPLALHMKNHEHSS